MHELPDALSNGPQAPLGAGGVTAHVCDTTLRMLGTFGREKIYGQDMGEELSQDERDAKVFALLGQRYIPPGFATQDAYWAARADACRRRLAEAVQEAVTGIKNESGRTPTVLGADGTPREREAEFRALVRAEQPVVSVSFTGSPRRWLATGDPQATSVSVTTFIPGRPLYAAEVTTDTALLSDCSGSWRLSRDDGWLAMTGEPTVADEDPNYVVLPHAMMDSASRMRRHYREPLFPFDTSSAVAQAVLGGAVPVAFHLTEPVLNSAVIPVAIGHGMIVMFLDSGELLEKPWAASRHMYKAVIGETSFGDFIIARNLLAARRIRRILLDEILVEDPDPLAPFGDLDDDFDLDDV
ncbi:hypothetical protein ACIF8T_22900 [Streptomyces sp. NPDC085946]|uniref:hypothetical protein n=1 Tax=Streptomyces sp. NPDC085946 TaxID=3365744 RepID=UPI0037D27CF3